MYPSMEQVMELVKEYNVIPISRVMLADMETPIRVYQCFKQERYAFLLESAENGTTWGRYSYIGMAPFLILRGKNGVLFLQEGDQQQVLDEDLTSSLRQLLQAYRSPALPELPPLTGGVAGYLGYDLVQQLASSPRHTLDDLNISDLQLMFCDQLIVFDHLHQEMRMIVNIHLPEGVTDEELQASYEAASKRLLQLERTIIAGMNHLKQKRSIHRLERQQGASIDDQDNTQAVLTVKIKQAQESIAQGEITKVVVSQRLECSTKVHPLDAYRMLRRSKPSAYMYLLKLADETIMGSSEASFMKPSSDAAGLHGATGYAKTDQKKDFIADLSTHFPSEEAIGNPKAAALNMISQLEHHARGMYGGAVGYISFSNNPDFCTVQNNIVFKYGKAYVQAGLQINTDDAPEAKAQQLMDAARSLLHIVHTAEQMFGMKAKESCVHAPRSFPLQRFSQVNQDYFMVLESPMDIMERGILG